jgi:hypothetical protein
MQRVTLISMALTGVVPILVGIVERRVTTSA